MSQNLEIEDVLTGEIVVLCENKGWIWNFISNTLNQSSIKFIRLSPDLHIRQSWARFKKAPRIIIHWENQIRNGGAIIEEIFDAAPDFAVGERIIICTAAPTREDVVYFGELGIKKIHILRNKELELKKSSEELIVNLSSGAERNPVDRLWRKLTSHIDSLFDPSIEQIDQLEMKVKTLLETIKDHSSARYLDIEASLANFRKDTEKAQKLWTNAIEKNPNYYRSYYNLIKFFREHKRFQDALSMLQKLNELNKSNISRLVNMGEVYAEIGDDQKAKHYFDQALERDKYCSKALNGKAEILFKEGDLDNCRNLLSKSQQATSTASKLNKLGIEMVKTGKYSEAYEHYTNAQYVLPQQEKGPLLFFNIGLCFSKWGKADMAKEFLKIALIKDPEYDKARRLLLTIENNEKNLAS